MTIEIVWGCGLLMMSAICIMWTSLSDKAGGGLPMGGAVLGAMAGIGIALWEPAIIPGYLYLEESLPSGDEGLRIITAFLIVLLGYVLSLAVWGAGWFLLPAVGGRTYRNFVARDVDRMSQHTDSMYGRPTESKEK